MSADVPVSRCFQKPNVFSRTRLAFPAETDFPLACLRIRIREQELIFHARKLSETPEIQFQGVVNFFLSTSPWYPNGFDFTKEIVLGGNMDISILFQEYLGR